ncbi:MAG: FecR family protein [Neptuniibacter sp.]
MNYIARILIQVFLCTILFPSLSFAEEAIGKVVLALGHPLVERNNQHILIKRNDPLFQKDTLITPVGSRILITLKDKSRISLAENTEFSLTQYEFNKQSSNVQFNMLKGAFRTLTGSIGKQKDPKFEIHTPIATIGVRGTEFWGGFIFTGDLDVTMLEGKGVYITNEYGTVDIKNPGEGTMVRSGQAPSEITRWSTEKIKKAAAATLVKEAEQETESPLDY